MREFLRGLELDEETIDTIMAEHGKHLTKLKEQVDDYRSKINDYDDKIKELNNNLEANTKNLENYQNMANENKDLKAQLQMSGSNVRKEFKDFVKSEVLSRVNDEVDFDHALNQYKQENPQYFGEANVSRVQTSPNLGGGNTAPQTTNSIMNDLLRSATNND